MAKTAQNTPGVVTVYDEDGKSSVCSLIDAKERVLTGRWSYSPTAPKEPVVEDPEPVAEEAAPPEEVKRDEPRSGGRKRQVKR